MSKTRLWIILLLALLSLIIIGLNLTNNARTPATATGNSQEPTYRSDQAITQVYSPEGQLTYKLIASQVQYYAEQHLSWFTRPQLTLYDQNKIATWRISADRAKLTDNDKMLYLYQNVQVNSLVDEAPIKKISTEEAQVNLTSQDVTSDSAVTIYGANFTSAGLKMRGNLRERKATLIEQVKTSYEIPKRAVAP